MKKPGRITKRTALRLLRDASLLELGRMADAVRSIIYSEGTVTFVVDRNINYTNICINRCRFCAFYRDADHPEGYILSKSEIFSKIDETIALGGTQILIQGGLNPSLGIEYYLDLLKSIKERYKITVHGFSPPEIAFIADSSNLTVRETLVLLREAGLDSIPGGGAEILSDRVREFLSPKKLRTSGWLKVMREAHMLGMRTTATMMFGAKESPEDIVEHLDRIRELQDLTGGFTAFIPWSFQPGNTEFRGMVPATAVDYLRVLSLSRIYLDNVKSIQASWVTQGLKMAQIALRFGANDMGSTMIEENVVKAAGVSHKVSMEEMIGAIKAAGFIAAQRDTYYNLVKRF